MDLGDGKEDELEEEGQENSEENQDDLFMEHGASGISDDKKFKKNTSEENLKNKNEGKKNIRNVGNEKEEKAEQMNTSTHNSNVTSQIKCIFSVF